MSPELMLAEQLSTPLGLLEAAAGIFMYAFLIKLLTLWFRDILAQMQEFI